MRTAMRPMIPIAALLAAALAAPEASADEQAECLAGIDMIRAEIARNPPRPVLDKLTRALRIAEREKGEKEWDECLDAVKEARKAVGK